ncbi:tumor necrosis factor receptor superfamily member 14 isoform X2 [Microcaecilia unicolor]|uniref:Tumor necrosis factor receptor superfamily member 5 n=1 Tax=Microcaecilia unicolor TaxID=1415580 RepID=A0A6P7WVW9_9AMPH|nr:tumor necrosis factor receptor superfamily member 14 isoform X2 [Microcaecilia unicolor]
MPLYKKIFSILFFLIFHTEAQMCRDNEYLSETTCCPLCPPGTKVLDHCTVLSVRTCINCTKGTYMDHSNANKECDQCKSCDRDMGLSEKQSCTYTRDTVCSCQNVFYCTKVKGDDCGLCQKQRVCKPGCYVKNPGTETTDTVCESCPEGTFSTGNMSQKCEPWTKCTDRNMIEVKSGTHKSDSVCIVKTKIVPVVLGITSPFVLIAVFGVLYYVWRKKRPFGFPHYYSGCCSKENSEIDGRVEGIAPNPDNMDGQRSNPNSEKYAQESHIPLAKGLNESPPRAETDNREHYLKKKISENEEESLLPPNTSRKVIVNIQQTVNISLFKDDDSGVHSSEHVPEADFVFSAPVQEMGK